MSDHSTLMKRSPLVRYGVAVLAVAVALALKLLLDPLIEEESPFLLFLGAVAVGAWFGGLRPGLLATALAALVSDYYFLSSGYSFRIESFGQGLRLFLFVLEGTFVSVLTTEMRSARLRAEASALEAWGHREDLRRTEERYRAVIEQAAEGIHLSDVETKRILESNAAFQDLLGYTARELQQMTLYDFIAHDRESIDAHAQRILAQGSHTIGERQYRRKDGSLVDVEVNTSMISLGGRQVVCTVAHDVTERKKADERLRHSLNSLLALYEAGQILNSTLELEEVGTRLLQIMQRISGLTTAVISVPDEHGKLRVWRAIGFENLWRKARYTPRVQAALDAALSTAEYQRFELPSLGSDGEGLMVQCLPLRVRDRLIGVLEIYGPENLVEEDTGGILRSLATQAASALENGRLYGELAERERQLKDLVGKLITAQEKERRRIAYDIHDGLTQVAVATYQHLQAFADDHPLRSVREQEQLEQSLKLAQQTASEARHVIAGLRPMVLDDFGLATAIRSQVDVLLGEGWSVRYEETLGDERLPIELETALFRVSQEALTNVRKHARTDRVDITLQRLEGHLRLEVRDWGQGFRTTGAAAGGKPGERIGLSSMQERVALLGGDFELHSEPGAGTSIRVVVPLPVSEEGENHEG